MTITALPPVPSRSDAPATFISKADAFLAALPQFATEANDTAALLNIGSVSDTSATSNVIGTGAKTFTVSAGKSFAGGMYLVIADTAAPSTNSMFCQVTSYSGTTLIVNVISIRGSGTKTAWTISLTSSGGAQTGANSDITSLTAVTAISTTGGVDIKGTNTNDSAAAGDVGEYVESIVLLASAIALTTNTITNITSISLTAGDWDVSGCIVFSPSGTTSITNLVGTTNSTSVTVPTLEQRLFTINQPATVPGNSVSFSGSSRRYSLSTTTTIYLIVNSTFTVSTLSAYGKISARRIR